MRPFSARPLFLLDLSTGETTPVQSPVKLFSFTCEHFVLVGKNKGGEGSVSIRERTRPLDRLSRALNAKNDGNKEI